MCKIHGKCRKIHSPAFKKKSTKYLYHSIKGTRMPTRDILDKMSKALPLHKAKIPPPPHFHSALCSTGGPAQGHRLNH